jgi:hypothetical protein
MLFVSGKRNIELKDCSPTVMPFVGVLAIVNTEATL